MTAIDALQADFADALLVPTRPVPAVVVRSAGSPAERRFAVYRNNVLAGLVEALATRFPVTRRLVGDDFFGAMGQVFVRDNLPRSPIMLRYGEDFPDFVATFAPAETVPYLADVARLELLRGRAYHAADAAPLGYAAFAAVSAADLGELRVRRHPAAAILRSPHPVVSIWAAHQTDDAPAVIGWTAQDALVTRPALEVEIRLLAPGTAAFLSALFEGVPIAAAALAGTQDDPAFDLATAFALLIEAGLVTAFR